MIISCAQKRSFTISPKIYKVFRSNTTLCFFHIQSFKTLEFTCSSLIQKGSYGQLYKARFLSGDSSLPNTVVIKIISKKTSIQRDESIREFQIQKSLNHPNIVSAHYLGEDSSSIYIVMDYIEGTDIFTVLSDQILSSSSSEFGLSSIQWNTCYLSITSALDYMHSQGIGHRDIKHENILLGNNGIFYLCDFGFSNTFVEISKKPCLIGTSGFIFRPAFTFDSTHQLRGISGSNGDLADFYSLGVVLLTSIDRECLISHQKHYKVFNKYIQSNQEIEAETCVNTFYALLIHRTNQLPEPYKFIILSLLKTDNFSPIIQRPK